VTGDGTLGTAAVAAGWHPLAFVHELRDRPLARMLMDRPVVLWRDEQTPYAFVDRCPHRNVPLSAGRVRAGTIACPYHGWRFDGDGRCVEVPGADTVPMVSATRLPVREVAGLLWTCLAAEPPPFPELPASLHDEAMDRFWWPRSSYEARLLDAIENLLDPAHPHDLHPWLVRRPDARRPVSVTVRGCDRGLEARYVERAVDQAWLPRLFEGRRTVSIGRYVAPTIAQLAFESADGPTFAITVVFSPETVDRTRPFAHFASRAGRLPAWIKRALLCTFHRPVLAQDAAMLARQAQTVARFGRPEYAVGPLDLMGPTIHRLARGDVVAPFEREATFWL
jgi:phenylpropionate dioxygenase-like ring-hydroxylating dioxygenase large terminal subunit